MTITELAADLDVDDLLLAVGSDYNLLLISRFKEEIGAGLNTGIIQAMGGTGSVVTAAGLLFDTLIVRSFMTPSIAALLARWFWWPQRVRGRSVMAARA